MKTEIWKDVLGYEGLYQVSNLGRVKSLKRNKEQIIGGGKCKGGYTQLILRKDNKSKMLLLHRIVWEAFNGFIEKGITVDHIDGDKVNNRISNLQLMSRGDNSRKEWLGKKHTEESKRKMSDSHRNKKLAEETKRKISDYRKGKRHSELTKQKIKESWKKRKMEL